jgi:hypothetical protein
MPSRLRGEVALVAGADGTETPQSKDIIHILRRSVMDDAAAVIVTATAIVYDVQFEQPAASAGKLYRGIN